MRSAAVSALGVVLLAATLASADAGVKDPRLAYSADAAISLYKARGWTQEAPGAMRLKLQNAARKLTISVQVEELGRAMSLAEYLEHARRRLPKGMRILEERPLSLSGLQGRALDSEFALRGVTLRLVQYVVIQGTKAYVVTGGAPADVFEAEQDALELVMRTFQRHAK